LPRAESAFTPFVRLGVFAGIEPERPRQGLVKDDGYHRNLAAIT